MWIMHLLELLTESAITFIGYNASRRNDNVAWFVHEQMYCAEAFLMHLAADLNFVRQDTIH